jgi:hypothetical protein
VRGASTLGKKWVGCGAVWHEGNSPMRTVVDCRVV